MTAGRQRIVLFSHPAEHTTGRYFARAVRNGGEVDVEYRMVLHDVADLGYAPDLFFFVDPSPGHWPLGIERLKCPTACYLIDVHQHLESRLMAARFFDFVFIAQKDYVAQFAKAGIAASWLPLAADPNVHRVPGLQRHLDVAFVGKLGLRNTRRHDVLAAALPLFRTNDYRATYAPQEMGRIYSRAKIVFNCSINGDLNMRVFEGMAAGALLVTDRIGNGLEEMFQEDIHYVGYSSTGEAVDKIRYYLRDDAARCRLAERGQREVLQFHSYARRWASAIDRISRETRQGSCRAALRDATASEVTKAYIAMFEHLRQPAQIFAMMRARGVSGALLRAWARAAARWLNGKVPLTSGAIRNRLRSF